MTLSSMVKKANQKTKVEEGEEVEAQKDTRLAAKKSRQRKKCKKKDIFRGGIMTIFSILIQLFFYPRDDIAYVVKEDIEK